MAKYSLNHIICFYPTFRKALYNNPAWTLDFTQININLQVSQPERNILLDFFDFSLIIIIKFEMSIHSFHKIIQGTALLLKTYSAGVPIKDQLKLNDLIQQLKVLKYETLGLEKAHEEKVGIGIRNIFEKGGLRITLYFMPAGEIMQLHNHPAMLVITYILKGALETEIYSPENTHLTFDQQKMYLREGEVSFIDGMRTNDKNLHQLRAIQDTFFIDILFPDYDEAKQCVFFEIEKQISDTKYILKETEAKEVHFFQI